MFARFICLLCLFSVFIVCLWSPQVATAAELKQGAGEFEPAPSPDSDLDRSWERDSDPRVIAGSEESSPPIGENRFDRISSDFFAPEKQNLAGLIGQSEISVLADVDGQFINSLSGYQMFEDESMLKIGEATLQESIHAGRSFSRESLAALARIDQAKAQTDQALALLLPNVYLRANYGQETSEPSVVVDEVSGELAPHDRHMRTDVTFTATQPLFDLPGFLDWRRRKVREVAREEGFRVADGDAYVATVNTYLALVASRLQVTVARDFAAQLNALLEYIEKRADAGAASISDMSRVRARSQETVSMQLELESAHLAAWAEFVRLTNLVPGMIRLPVLADVGVSALPEKFESAVAAAMESNPEIAALSAELKAEGIDRAVAKSVFLPRFDAEYTDTYSDHAGGSEDSQRDRRIMLVMNWNLFNGGKDYRYYQERVARYRELQYLLDDRRRRVIQSLSANYATLTTTSERIETGYEELRSISTAADAMTERMLSGNQSLLDLLTVYDRYYRVRSRLIDLHVLRMNTVAELVRLTKSTPWPAPEMM